MSQSMSLIFVILLRLIIPLLIFRRPLLGGVASVLLDAVDVNIVRIMGGTFPNYQQLDKYLDTYYLFFEFVVSLGWDHRLAKQTSVLLFLYRVVGVVLFEVTNTRVFLLFFPNLFEYFFLFFVIFKRRYFDSNKVNSWSRVVLILVLLYILKLPQEYLLHFKQVSPWLWFATEVLPSLR